jgi:hypothetical protein
MLEQLDSIAANIEALNRRVGGLENSDEEDPVASMAKEIRTIIPRVKDADVIEELEPSEASMPPVELVGTYGSIEDIITYMTDKRDVRRERVVEAIDRLEDNLPGSIKRVKHVSGTGESRHIEPRICEVR